jgi:hypothetical protein
MPSESAYVFAAHSAQGPPGGPKKPRPHRQSVCASLRGGDCEFTEQASHAAVPSASAYAFAAHSAQGPPCGPKKPRLQRQSVCTSLTAGACECSTHSAQVAVPSASAYVFTGHMAQGPTAGHCRHSLYARRCAGEPPSALHSPHTPPCQACQRRCSPRIQCTPRRSARRTRDDNGSL